MAKLETEISAKNFQIQRHLCISLKASLCIVFFVSFLCYSNTLQAEFVYDDTRAILKNEDLRPEAPFTNIFYNDFWGTPLKHSGSHKSYRPLCVLTFRLNYMFGALNPFGYHLVNVLLHCMVSSLFTIYCFEIFGKEWLSFLGGLLFAAHPIHTEAVAGVVGRADVGSALFFLLSLISYHNAVKKIKYDLEKSSDKVWFTLCLLFALLSMYTKEQGVTVLGVIVAYEMLMVTQCNFASPRSIIKLLRASGGFIRIIILTLYTLLILYTRLLIMGYSPPEFAPADNPAASAESSLTRSLTFLYLPSVNIWLLLYPWNLSYDYSMTTIPLIESVFQLENICSVTLYGSLLLIAYSFLKYSHLYDSKNTKKLSQKQPTAQLSKKHQQTINGESSLTNQRTAVYDNFTWETFNILILALALLILPFLPASNLFFYVGFVVAERILYIPSIGYCFLVVNGLNVLARVYYARQKELLLMTSAILLLFSAKTFDRNFVWKDEESLYRSGLEMSPAKSFANLANVYVRNNQTREAEHAYRSALKYRGNMADAHYNLGILLQNENRFEEAVQSYKDAIQFRPRLASAHLNMGVTLRSMGKKQEALEVFMDAYNISDHGLKDPATHATALTSIRYNAGMTMFDLGQYHDSIKVFLDALKKMPDNYEPHSLYNMLGQAYAGLNETIYAESWYIRALRSKENHVPALLAYANLLKNSENEEEKRKAETNYKKAIAIEPARSESYLLYASFLAQTKRETKAMAIIEKLLKQDPKNLQAMNHASALCRDMQHYEEALKYQIMATTVYPDRSDLLVNLGALYHLLNKFEDATSAYQKALQLDPKNQLLLDNIRKLERARNKSNI